MTDEELLAAAAKAADARIAKADRDIRTFVRERLDERAATLLDIIHDVAHLTEQVRAMQIEFEDGGMVHRMEQAHYTLATTIDALKHGPTEMTTSGDVHITMTAAEGGDTPPAT